MKKKNVQNCIVALGALILFLLQFLLHRNVPFMMDDEWYGTNLVTGEALRSLGDVIESQAWHFMHWGGRSITHGVLQLTLMSGELVADILNVVMTLLLCLLVYVLSGSRQPVWFLAAGSMMVAFNANCRMSMFWQSGLVNYVYSTVWIFVFLWVFLRELEGEAKALPAVSVWMIPLGLITGWSNENMGPASFLLAGGVTAYLVLKKGRKLRLWMIEGVLMSLVGSVLVVAAPGNFARSSAIEKGSLGEELYHRFYSMLCASVEYLFPTLLFLILAILLCCVCGKISFRPYQWCLLIMGVLAHGAMVLSPHYPDRATFGIMMIGIVLIISLLSELMRTYEKARPYSMALLGCVWLYAVYELGGYLYFAEEMITSR